MKRVLLYLALLSLSTSCISQETNEDVKSISTFKFLTESAVQLKDYEWLSFNVDMVALKDGKVWHDRKYDVILHYDKKNPLIFVSHKDEEGYTDNIFRMDKKAITIIDKTTNEFTIR